MSAAAEVHLFAFQTTDYRPPSRPPGPPRSPGDGRLGASAHSILVVEDDRDIRAQLQVALEREGCAVRSAENGIQALKALESAPPDAVVLDLHLPHINGFQVLEAIRNSPRLREIPVTAISAVYLDRAAVEQALVGLKQARFQPKPFSPLDMARRVAGETRDSASGAGTSAATAPPASVRAPSPPVIPVSALAPTPPAAPTLRPPASPEAPRPAAPTRAPVPPAPAGAPRPAAGTGASYPGLDRRGERRLKIRHPAWVQLARGDVPIWLADVSTRGFRIAGPTDVARPGDRIRLRFVPPGGTGQEVRLLARVVWTGPARTTLERAEYGLQDELVGVGHQALESWRHQVHLSIAREVWDHWKD